jgi:predicted DNA-binding transcriptional regulator AlpA
VKLGRFVRFKEREVLKWLESKNNKGRKTKAVEIEF